MQAIETHANPNGSTRPTSQQSILAREQISDVSNFLLQVAAHKEAYTVQHDGIELVVHPNVFSPRYSHSSDFLIELLKVRRGERVLDVGCGTGVLGIAALRRGAAHATFVDLNPEALRNTQANLNRLSLAGAAQTVLSDVFSNVTGTFDLIVSNPPFWDRPAASMIERACFDEGHSFLRQLIGNAENYATKDARLALVMSNQSDTALAMRLMTAHGWYVREQRFASAETHGVSTRPHVRVAWICDRNPLL